jgi:hypothetical protein
MGRKRRGRKLVYINFQEENQEKEEERLYIFKPLKKIHFQIAADTVQVRSEQGNCIRGNHLILNSQQVIHIREKTLRCLITRKEFTDNPYGLEQ